MSKNIYKYVGPSNLSRVLASVDHEKMRVKFQLIAKQNALKPNQHLRKKLQK